ncbi:hypothetical protein H7J55_02105, partial [Mycolicibacterium brisbanense]|nr:hypothetical protein [Mycolicibacterium brisbanense]
ATTGKPLVDVIVDEAEQKGTGRWTVKSALDLGVPVTGIAEAVFARALSGSVPQRKATAGLASGTLGDKPTDTQQFIDDVRQALYASKIVAYAQGFNQIQAGSTEYDWNITPGDLALYASKIVAYAQGFNQIQAGSTEYDWNITPGDLATIWRGGCIIRAKFLNRIKDAYDADPQLATLLAAPGHHLARRLHHPRQIPQPHQRRLRRRPAAGHPARRALLPRRRRSRHQQLAPRRHHRHRPGHPHPRLLLSPVLLRRATHRTAPRRPHPRPTRLLRRPHLRTHRRRTRPKIPHPLERRPHRNPGLETGPLAM